MERKFIEQLKKWKDNNIKEPLMVIGARQTGKTYIIQEFCKGNYENYIYLNFEDINQLDSAFEQDLIPENIIKRIEIIINKDIDIENSVIFFDEIQISEKAINSLKYFCESEINYRIICAGSLLGVKLHRFKSSFPVGKVRILNMYPMDFEEFLWACDEKKLSNEIRSCYNEERQMIDILHEKALKYYLDYLYIGGMPQAVKNYVENGKDAMKFEREIHTSIITAYIADMRKYTVNASETVKISEIYESIPRQLAKENTKFKYNVVNPMANKREYELPLDWLMSSGLIYKANKCEKVQSPLRAFLDQSNFKIYMNDVGLLSTLSRINVKDIQFGDDNTFRGGITENFVAQMLVTKGYDLIYFKPTQTMEIDFVITEENGSVIPIEVKAGEHVRSRSLSNYILKYSPEYVIRLSARNFGFNNNIKSIPLYAAHLI